MRRLVLSATLAAFAIGAFAQSSTQPAISDPAAVSIAQKSVAALTGGAPITDVTLNANVISIFGADSETGTGTFSAKGTSESRVDLSLSGGTRSDVRNALTGVPAGAWEKNSGSATAYAQHNCWTDAAWFFPALSSLTQTINPNFVFRYVGEGQYGGLPAQHIQVFQISSQDTTGTVQRLSASDFYLDATSNLPLGVTFQSHADNNMNTDIPTEVRFANYQSVNGIQVPFHFQWLLNGGVVEDVTVTSAVFNTGLQDTAFDLQ